MQIVRFWTAMGPRYGLLDGDEVKELAASPFSAPGLKLAAARYNLSEVRLLPPAEPTKIVLGSRNYRTMLKNRGWQEPGEVMFGLKPLTSLAGPEDPILLPPNGKSYTFECELAVIIGRTCCEVDEADVDGVILGYSCLSDAQVFDIYERTGLTFHSKGYDSFTLVGPTIQTELEPTDVWIKSFINGRQTSNTHTSDMIYGARKLVSVLSYLMTLYPGDILATGNSGGKLPITVGDRIDVVIDGVGTLSNPVVARSYPADSAHVPNELYPSRP